MRGNFQHPPGSGRLRSFIASTSVVRRELWHSCVTFRTGSSARKTRRRGRRDALKALRTRDYDWLLAFRAWRFADLADADRLIQLLLDRRISLAPTLSLPAPC